MGDKPTHRLIKRKDDGTGWDIIGAAWPREKGGFSVNLEFKRGDPKIKCLLVEIEDKPKTSEPPPAHEDNIPF